MPGILTGLVLRCGTLPRHAAHAPRAVSSSCTGRAGGACSGCRADTGCGVAAQTNGANCECKGRVWRMDVGMSKGVLDAPPQVRHEP